jgi:integrase
VFFKNKTTISVSETVAENFRDWLLSDRSLKPVTVRERIVMMNACWEWALKKKLVLENPWADVKVSVAPCTAPAALHTGRNKRDRTQIPVRLKSRSLR